MSTLGAWFGMCSSPSAVLLAIAMLIAACGQVDKRVDTAGDSSAPDSAETADTDTETDPPVVHCLGSGGWMAVSAGWEGTCGIHADGCLECWTAADTGPPSPRIDETGYSGPNGFLVPPHEDVAYASVDLAAQTDRPSHTCAIRRDGGIDCWGSAAGHATSPPKGEWAQLSVGDGDACALGQDGRVACWGKYIGPGEDALYSPADDYVRVSNARLVVCGLGGDGRIDCWGTSVPSGIFESLSGPWVAMDNSMAYVYGVTPDGVVRNVSGELRMPQSPDGVVDLCIGGYAYSVCILDTAGAVRCTGDLDGAPDATFTSVSCGWIHACGVTVDEQILCWGDCRAGSCDVPVHD